MYIDDYVVKIGLIGDQTWRWMRFNRWSNQADILYEIMYTYYNKREYKRNVGNHCFAI